MDKVRGAEHFSFLDVPRAIWFFLDTERWKYLGYTVILIAVLFYMMLPPYLIGKIANFLIEYIARETDKPSLNQLWWLVGILAVAHTTAGFLRLSTKRVLGLISLNTRYRAKVWSFERLLNNSLVWHQQENTGNKVQRIFTGAEAVKEWSGDILNNLFPVVVAFVGSLIACSLLHPAFVLFFIFYIGGLIGIEILFDKKISLLSERINQSIENASGTFVEGSSNILAVKALGATGKMVNKIAQREEDAKALSYQRLKLTNTKWMCFQLHNALSWSLYLLLIAYAVVNGELAVGFFLTYAVYFDRLRETATEFTNRIQQMIERKSNLGRLMPLFWKDDSFNRGKEKFPVDWKTLVLREAVFRYDKKEVLGPLTMDIHRGEIIGIAGPSGSGKSTFIKLLLGLYHLHQGRLQLDDVSISTIQHEELTANIAVVLQETELFSFSLKDNITLMRDTNPALLERACRVACLNDVIDRLPQGLDTAIGERGYSLSGGERQRIGIARAIYRDTAILLLDEATSALDPATELAVMNELIGEFTTLKTLIIVAHRMNTLKNADRIFVFKQGQMVEDGHYFN